MQERDEGRGEWWGELKSRGGRMRKGEELVGKIKRETHEEVGSRGIEREVGGLRGKLGD